MDRVTGLGGFFFKCADAHGQIDWYRKHLGIPINADYGGWNFEWSNAEDPRHKGMTVFSLFPESTEYFGPSPQRFMFNFRVKDLDGLLAALATEGVRIDPKREDAPYGRFAWIYDPEGNKIELWEPPEGARG
jgi:predicted enzyme related to lactoylglutathione lyase